MRITGAEVYGSDHKFHKKDLFIKDGLITDVAISDEEIIDASGCYAIPGLIDIHFHGAMGYDVCDGTMEAFEKIAEYEAGRGITAICPATLTLPVSKLKEILAVGAEFASRDYGKRKETMADLVGFNMEGPFISHIKKGAQNEEYIRKCDAGTVLEFVEASKGLVKIIGLAPEENAGFEDYIKAVRDNVKVSLAHTNADYDTAMKAFEAGACHAVHLYNAMTGMSHRQPGVVGAVFDKRDVTAELICDGIHIHPAVVRTSFELLGKDRLIMISDGLRATGMPDGEYELGGLATVKKGREIRLATDGAIAGSGTDLMGCLQTAVLEMGIPLEIAVAAATINPAKCIGIDNEYGSLENGKKANVVLLDKKNLKVKRVIKR